MNDIIHLLPDSVANQIAAGEVVQRPSSVIKELVENAIDAEATTIDVLVTDAGRTSIRVIDNGKGMSATDARLAFERHATSKINKAEDLFNLRTMGFRGEALASISAVAQVELTTRQEKNELGTKIIISASKVEKQEMINCPSGSSFMVNDLFFNIPARRRFLKSDKTELSNILVEFERIALVYPNIAFTLHHNGNELIHLPITNRRQRIIQLFGKKLNTQLIEVNVDTSIVQITGMVGKPETSKKKGSHQFLFVNGRYMRHPYFHRAVLGAFENLIPEGEQISYFLYFEIEPSNIDVNIHPTKTEIKFDNEQAIWQLIQAALRESIGKYSNVPAIDFDTEGRPDIPVYTTNSDAPSLPRPQVNPNFNPFQSHTGYTKQADKRDWQEIYDSTAPVQSESSRSDTQPAEIHTSIFSSNEEWIATEKSLRYYQLKGKYILTSVKSGLMILDQQRAHTRILHDQYITQIEQQKGHSQRLLFPEVIHFPASQLIQFQSIIDELTTIGFDFSDLGGGSFAINGLPAGTEGLSPINLVRTILDTALDDRPTTKQEIYAHIATSLAKASAIPYGQVLNNEEMSHVVDSLFACKLPNYTPDGKKIFSIISPTELDSYLE